jgi:hypothetical protein
MDLINEKRGLIGYKLNPVGPHVFTYKDIDHSQPIFGFLGVKLGNKTIYIEVISTAETRFLMGLILKAIIAESHTTDRVYNEVDTIDALISLGFNVVGISSINRREDTLLHDFETTYPNYLVAKKHFKPSTQLASTATYLRRSSYQVRLEIIREISNSNFDNKHLAPESFNYQQRYIPVKYHNTNRNTMLNFHQQLWLTNIPFPNFSKFFDVFFEAVDVLVASLHRRYANENIYHRIFASLSILKVNGFTFRPAMITRMAKGQFVITHRPYLQQDRLLSKDDYLLLKPVVDALSILSKEVKQ